MGNCLQYPGSGMVWEPNTLMGRVEVREEGCRFFFLQETTSKSKGPLYKYIANRNFENELANACQPNTRRDSPKCYLGEREHQAVGGEEDNRIVTFCPLKEW